MIRIYFPISEVDFICILKYNFNEIYSNLPSCMHSNAFEIWIYLATGNEEQCTLLFVFWGLLRWLVKWKGTFFFRNIIVNIFWYFDILCPGRRSEGSHHQCGRQSVCLLSGDRLWPVGRHPQGYTKWVISYFSLLCGDKTLTLFENKWISSVHVHLMIWFVNTRDKINRFASQFVTDQNPANQFYVCFASGIVWSQSQNFP